MLLRWTYKTELSINLPTSLTYYKLFKGLKIIAKVENYKNKIMAAMAHAYNPSYSGGRDQEDRGSKSAQANSSWDPISKKKKTHHKKGLAEWLKV
jgi:hypothetical protein